MNLNNSFKVHMDFNFQLIISENLCSTIQTCHLSAYTAIDQINTFVHLCMCSHL